MTTTAEPYSPFQATTLAPLSLDRVCGLRKLSVSEYHKMMEAGILREGERIELLEGYLVKKMSHNTPHGVAVQKLNKRLVLLAPPGWEARCQLPITLSDSEPEPDGVLARGDESTFAVHHPLAPEIGLVVEVADSSLQWDRGEKSRIYARAGLPVYWIVNLVDRVVEVYTEPDTAGIPPAYRVHTDYHPGQSIPVVLDGKEIGTILAGDLLT